MVRLPRYTQQETITPQGPAPFMNQRMPNPLEGLSVIGEGLAQVAMQKRREFEVNQAENLQTDINRLSLDVEQKIDQGEILGDEQLAEYWETELENIRSNYEPEIVEKINPLIRRSSDILSAKLKRDLWMKQNDTTRAGHQEYVETETRLAIDAPEEQLSVHLGNIEANWQSMAAANLYTEQEARQQANAAKDFIYAARLENELRKPFPDLIALQIKIEEWDITPETRQQLRGIIDARLDQKTTDDLFLSFFDEIRTAEDTGADLDAIEQEIRASEHLLGRSEILSLLGQIENVRQGRETNREDLILNRIQDTYLVDEDPDRALQILEENKESLEPDVYSDTRRNIELFRKDKNESALREQQALNYAFVLEDVIQGISAGRLNRQNIEPYVNNYVRGQRISASQATAIYQSALSLIRQRNADLLENAKLLEQLNNGQKPFNKKAVSEVWKKFYADNATPQSTKAFIDQFGVIPEHKDLVKDYIFSDNPVSFAQGVDIGMKIWYESPKQFREMFDSETQKAIFWGFQEIRHFDELDSMGDSPDPALNLDNAHKTVMERLFPKSEAFGISQPYQEIETVRKVTDRYLDSIFYTPGIISGYTLTGPTLDYLSKFIGSFFGDKTFSYRSQADFSTFLERMPPLPVEAREYFANLVQGEVLDGFEINKAMERAIPEFLELYGLTRIGVQGGGIDARWQIAPPETFIKRLFTTPESQKQALEIFYDSVYQEAVRLSQNDPRIKKPLEYKPSKVGFPRKFYERYIKGPAFADREILAEPIIPPVRLIPVLDTLNQPVPDYFLGYVDENGTFIQLFENNEPKIIQGIKVIDALKNESTGVNAQLYNEAK